LIKKRIKIATEINTRIAHNQTDNTSNTHTRIQDKKSTACRNAKEKKNEKMTPAFWDAFCCEPTITAGEPVRGLGLPVARASVVCCGLNKLEARLELALLNGSFMFFRLFF
jgi:hypothetical protein